MTDRYAARSLARIARDLAKLVDRLIESAPPSDNPDVTRFERAILEALAPGEAMPGKKLAKISGYSYGGRLRATLADMVRRKLLVHGPDGYRINVSGSPTGNGRTTT